jgi:hypothetical protein
MRCRPTPDEQPVILHNAEQERPPQRAFRVRYLLFSFLLLTVCFTGLELAARGYIRWRAHGLVQPYDLTGWRPTPNSTFDRNVAGYGRVHFTIGRDGFREWSEADSSSHPRVLFIGDSFTHGHTVSDGKAYYDVVHQQFPQTNLYVFGCIGYGTLQEYLIFDRYIDQVNPDLIIWQFCQNDIINNDYELESQSPAQNNHVPRPYLQDDDSIDFLYPRQRTSWLSFSARYLYVFRLVDEWSDTTTWAKRTIETDLTSSSPLQQRSAETTRRIMALVRKRAGNRPIVDFSDCRASWAGSAYKNACESNGITYAPEIENTMSEARAAKKPVIGTNGDYHWNEAGNRLAGNTLAKFLRSHGYLDARTSHSGVLTTR